MVSLDLPSDILLHPGGVFNKLVWQWQVVAWLKEGKHCVCAEREGADLSFCLGWGEEEWRGKEGRRGVGRRGDEGRGEGEGSFP